MCSIPGLPTPGSEVPVLIVRASLNPCYGLVELWINMDDGSKHIYAQMKDEIQVPQRQFYGPEGKPGDLCLVCISDTWHRARIVSIQIETYNVYLIDQGQPHIVTSEALAWGQSESFLLPPEMESCILANIFSPQTEWPERATKLLMSLPGKTFKGLVQHVLMPDRIILLDILTISNQMCQLGAAKKMDETEFKMLVQKCLQGVEGSVSPETSCLALEYNLDVNCKPANHDQFLYPELLTNTFETVIVTEVTGPQNIFCKLLIFSKAVKLLSEQIHQHYEEGSDLDEAPHLSCGDPCAARGLDGKWHRSLLKKNIVTSESTLEVFHVDEGKAELVNVGDVRPLLGKFLRMPVVTYRCSLSGVKANKDWTADETDYLKSLLLHQTVIAKFDYINAPQDAYYVTLYADDAACFNKMFLDRAGLLQSSKSEWELQIQSGSSPSTISVGENGFVDAHDKINLINGLPEKITKSQVVNGRMGNGSTTSVDDTDVQANCDVHDPLPCNGHLSMVSSCESLSTCEDVFAVGKSINVKVSCIESPQRFWCQTVESGNSLRRFMEDLQNHYASAHPQPLTAAVCVARNPDNNIWYRAKILANQDSPTVEVRFIDYGQTQKIPLQNLCRIDPVFLQLTPQAFQCSLFSLKNPSNPTPARCIDAAIAEFQEFVDSAHSSGSGLKCIIKAKSEEDGLLVDVEDLKSAPKSTFDGSLNVNPVVVSEIKPQKIPGLTQQLLTGSERVALTNEDCSIQELDKRPSEQNVCGINGMYATPNASPPAMILNGDSRQTLNVKTKAKTSMQEFHSDLEMSRHSPCSGSERFGSTLYAWPDSSSNTMEVYASCIVGPHYFWCQSSNTENLDMVSKLAQEAGQEQEVMSSEVLKPGSPCLALFSNDKQWYRAQVIGKNDNTLNVLFVDYGNDSEVKMVNVRSLPTKLLEVPPQAFLCCMNGSDASNGTFDDDDDYDYFYNLLVDKLLKLTVMDVQKHSEIEAPQYSVEMECEGENVHALLQKYWKPVTGVNVTTSLETDASLQTASNMNHVCVPKEASGYVFKQPVLSRSKTEMVYASSIAEPHFFWCQFANPQELQKLSQLTQKAGQAQQDDGFPETLVPGSPCLARFSDNQWYRALVIAKADRTLRVLFSDYGNELEVDVINVRPLPQNLLEIPPRAFLCRLHGFNQSKGSWDEEAYDDFYYLLVDKLFRLTVFDMEEHPDINVPQYAVQMECEGVVINKTMAKYWKAEG